MRTVVMYLPYSITARFKSRLSAIFSLRILSNPLVKQKDTSQEELNKTLGVSEEVKEIEVMDSVLQKQIGKFEKENK